MDKIIFFNLEDIKWLIEGHQLVCHRLKIQCVLWLHNMMTFQLCTYLGHEWVYNEFNDLFDCPMQSIEASVSDFDEATFHHLKTWKL
jgi:hypothetical protein